MHVKTHKTRKRRAPLPADRIREMLDRGESRLEVRRKLHVSKQAVAAADAARRPRGRPAADRRRVQLHVAPDTDAWLRAEAERDGCTLGEVVDGARLAVTAADAGEDPALERALELSTHRCTDAPEHRSTMNGIAGACYRLQCFAAGLYADARSMRESFPELAAGHADRAAALSMASRVLLDVEQVSDFDRCAARARATRRVTVDEHQYGMVIARTDAVLQRSGAAHEASARLAELDPKRSAFTPDYHRARAAELRAKYGELDPTTDPETME
jgi:hypothetical protein